MSLRLSTKKDIKAYKEIHALIEPVLDKYKLNPSVLGELLIAEDVCFMGAYGMQDKAIAYLNGLFERLERGVDTAQCDC